MWVVIAVCAALGLRIFLVLSVLKSDARRWVRPSASVVIFSTAIALISVLEMISGFGLSVRFANVRNDVAWAVIYSFMALDIIGSVVLVATSSRGWRLAKALLIAAGFLAVFVQAIGVQLESL
jgi:hypothetical protein